MIKVSVIIPVYNVEKYIEHCARSLMEQTLMDIEYIFVDDCTPDHSMEILQRVLTDYPERLENIRIIHHTQNSGSAAVRNMRIWESKVLRWISWITDSPRRVYHTL